MTDARSRLARALVDLERRFEPVAATSSQRADVILRARAAAAAAAREEVVEPDLRVVAFRAAGALYGVPLPAVVAVAFLRTLTPLPGVPDALLGLLQVRGRHVTLVDLGLLCGGGGSDTGRRRIADESKAVLVSHVGREIALLAHEVLGIRDLRRRELRALSGTKAGAPIRTLGPDGLQVVDLGALFADERLAAPGPAGLRGGRAP